MASLLPVGVGDMQHSAGVAARSVMACSSRDAVETMAFELLIQAATHAAKLLPGMQPSGRRAVLASMGRYFGHVVRIIVRLRFFAFSGDRLSINGSMPPASVAYSREG